jgi:pectinesterase inhibitor-like protein
MAPSTSFTSVMSVVAVLLLLFPVAPALTPSEQAILAACKTVGGGSTYFDVQFCQEALSSVAGGNASLDYKVFGGLAVALLARNATSTMDKIDRLLRGGGAVGVNFQDQYALDLARCLMSCRSLYGGILHDGPGCTAAIKAGNLGVATATLEKAAAAATECQDGFGKSFVISPLSAEYNNAFKLAKLGVALLEN